MLRPWRPSLVSCSFQLVSKRQKASSVLSFSSDKISKWSHSTASTSSPLLIDPACLVEEESLPTYRPQKYYPVRIGETFQQRYKVIGKLGYGAASTVWLCRDLQQQEPQYAALKVHINNSKVHRELPVYKHINAIQSDHPGRHRVRSFLDSFEVQGPHGTHVCPVHEPLGKSLNEFRHVVPDGNISTQIIREVFRYILQGLDFLHREANVIHTDLQAGNMLLGTNNNAVFEKYEKDEEEESAPRKELDDRAIYLSRAVPLSSGAPSLSDLSEARFGGSTNVEDIMPDQYRAPEVVLGLPWSYPVDVWALGLVIWELFEGTRLFDAMNPDKVYSERYHLAEMMAILGPPPPDLVLRSRTECENVRLAKKGEKFWDENGRPTAEFDLWHADLGTGRWICDIPTPDTSLESAEHRLEGEEKRLFLVFMRKMLQWKPEDRLDGHSLYHDEWLCGDLIEAGLADRDSLANAISEKCQVSSSE